MLINNPWRGNIRELRNYIYRMMVLTRANQSDLEVPESEKDSPTTSLISSPYPSQTMEAVEREHIKRVMENVNGNKTRAAEVLAIKRTTLLARMKKLGI